MLDVVTCIYTRGTTTTPSCRTTHTRTTALGGTHLTTCTTVIQILLCVRTPSTTTLLFLTTSLTTNTTVGGVAAQIYTRSVTTSLTNRTTLTRATYRPLCTTTPLTTNAALTPLTTSTTMFDMRHHIETMTHILPRDLFTAPWAKSPGRETNTISADTTALTIALLAGCIVPTSHNHGRLLMLWDNLG